MPKRKEFEKTLKEFANPPAQKKTPQQENQTQEDPETFGGILLQNQSFTDKNSSQRFNLFTMQQHPKSPQVVTKIPSNLEPPYDTEDETQPDKITNARNYMNQDLDPQCQDLDKILETPVTHQSSPDLISEIKKITQDNQELHAINTFLSGQLNALLTKQTEIVNFQQHIEAVQMALYADNTDISQFNQDMKLEEKKTQLVMLEQKNYILDQKNKELGQTNKILEKRNKILQQANKELEQKNNKLGKQVKVLEQKNKELEQKNKLPTDDEYWRMKKTYHILVQENDELRGNLLNLQFQKPLFSKQPLIKDVTVDPTNPQDSGNQLKKT